MYLNCLQENSARYGPLFPCPTFENWLVNANEGQGASRYQYFNAINNGNFSSQEDNDSVSSVDTNTSSGKTNRWTNTQTARLITLWKEKISDLESHKANETWVAIQEEINTSGPDKTLLQCKNKLRNLKDSYKRAKENNMSSGASPSFPPFYHEIDEILGTRDCINLPEMREVGVVGDVNSPEQVAQNDVAQNCNTEHDSADEINDDIALDQLTHGNGKFFLHSIFL